MKLLQGFLGNRLEALGVGNGDTVDRIRLILFVGIRNYLFNVISSFGKSRYIILDYFSVGQTETDPCSRNAFEVCN